MHCGKPVYLNRQSAAGRFLIAGDRRQLRQLHDRHRTCRDCRPIGSQSLLTRNKAPARLLFIYFVGDKRPDGISCPQSKAEWDPALHEQDSWLGLEREQFLSNRIYKLFVPGTTPKYRKSYIAVQSGRLAH